MTVAALALVGVLLTSGVTVARLSPGLGEGRHSIGVVTLDDLQEGQLATAAAIVLTFVAAVLGARTRRETTRRNLLLVVALSILAVNNMLSAVMTPGFDSLAANRFATWSTVGCAAVGALVLVLASVLPERKLRPDRRLWNIAAGGTAAILLCVVMAAWLLRDQLPGAFQSAPSRGADLELLSEHPALFTLELLAAVGYAVASLSFARIADRDDDDLYRWLALGLAVASVAYANYALFPSQYTEILYLGDFFYLVAVGILLVGAVRDVGNASADEVARAVYIERRRIARDLHDGVAQELAYLNALTQAVVHDPDSHSMSRVIDTIERAQDEARDAISLLSLPSGAPLSTAIGQAATRIAQRGGAMLELDLDPTVRVGRDAHVALVRITREAVYNAVRHGNARRISVELWGETGVRLRISDDGGGFDPAMPRATSGHGLTSMRERAQSLQGTFEVITAVGQGTVINVGLP